MSNDLISRSALMSHIESERRQWGEDYDVEQILGDIEDFPTAYDPDKVVEQLKELHEGYKCTDNEFQRGAKAGAHYVLNRAIEIVKGGGVDE